MLCRCVKEIKVFMQQILDVAAAVPVPSWALETTREYQDAQRK